MNILIISLRGPSNYNIKGGAREYLIQIGKGLVKEGHIVKILCGYEKDFDGKTLPTNEYVNGVEVSRIGDPYLRSYLLVKEYFIKYRNWADFVIENILTYPLLTPIYVNKPKITLVHHLMDKEYFSAVPKKQAIIGYTMEKILPFFYKKDYFITVSNSTKLDLIKLGIPSSNIYIVSPGVEHEIISGYEKTEDPLIFFIGKYGDGRKKVLDLIKSFKIVKKEIPNARLIIAGRGGELEKKLMRKYKNNKDIKILGPIDDIKKKYYYMTSWVFVNPSIKEGFSITTIEANLYGTPAISYKINGLNTIIENITGYTVTKRDIKNLAKKIIYLLNNKEIRQTMSENAKIHANKYSVNNSVIKFMHYIEEIHRMRT